VAPRKTNQSRRLLLLQHGVPGCQGDGKRLDIGAAPG